MTIYTVHFHTEADWAESDIEADTPELALEAAHRLAVEDVWMLDFRSYDGTNGIEYIEIMDPSGRPVAAWRNADLLLRLAAPDLLEALKYCDMTLADLEASKRKGYIAYAQTLIRDAIAKATGGAA